MTKKILLLGANGQLGQDFTLHTKVVPLTRQDVDISIENALTNCLKPYQFDILLNATAYNFTEKAEEERDLAYRVNAEAVLEMANVCNQKNATLIHVSTDYVFDGTKGAPYSEEDQINPLNVYGKSKAQGEKYASLANKHYIIRCASLFGGDGDNFIKKMIKLGRKRKTLHVIDEIIMSPTYSYDLAKMILELVDSEAPCGIYHGVNGGNASWYTFAKKIVETAQVDVELIPCSAKYYPSKIIRPLNSVLNNQKTAAFTGPVRSWEDAVVEYIRKI